MYIFLNSSEKSDSNNAIKNTFCTSKCVEEAVDGRLQCQCGEETPVFDWTWQDQHSTNIRMSNGCKEVLFHPVYSSGTAAVRGEFPFQQNYHYYWEIKIISRLYGTDVMIGVGTSKIVLRDWQFKFCSLLGSDSESWGYSYKGIIQHNDLRRKYGAPFGLGSIIGVHLDMCNGTLEYFLNRKSLGIAFSDLKGKDLYPMLCSTAAQSSMRITCCMSKEPSLQMMCLKQITEHPGLYREYKNIPGLTRLYERQFFWMKPRLSKEAEEKKRIAELDEDVTLSLVNAGYLVRNKRIRTLRLISLLYESYDVCDIDLGAASGREEPDRPSTSCKSNSRPSDGNETTNKISCSTCHSQTHKSEDCLLLNDLEDSDTDPEVPGLNIL